MQSFFVFFQTASEAEVAQDLESLGLDAQTAGNPWLVRAADSDPMMYANFYPPRRVLEERGPEAYDRLLSELGGEPRSILSFDISGRHYGTPAARDLAIALCKRHRAVVMDDVDDEHWTIPELEADQSPQGRPFLGLTP